MTAQHILSSSFIKHLLHLNMLSWLPVCSTHLCVGEVDIAHQGELSNLRVYKKSFITMLFFILKKDLFTFWRQINIGQWVGNKRNKCNFALFLSWTWQTFRWRRICRNRKTSCQLKEEYNCFKYKEKNVERIVTIHYLCPVVYEQKRGPPLADIQGLTDWRNICCKASHWSGLASFGFYWSV